MLDSVNFHAEPGNWRCEWHGREVPVRLRPNRHARRLILRVSPRGDEIRLTVPRRASETAMRSFLESQLGWLARQLETHGEEIPLVPGMTIPLFGQRCLLYRTKRRGGVNYTGRRLSIGCDEEHFERRVKDWIKAESKRVFAAEALELAAEIGKRPAAVTVRDTGSRWGSCSSTRRLSFSWRLAFAPAEVATYVIAHEVAHLKHFDHSPRFWNCVASLGVDAASSKHWLRVNGNMLHSIG